MIDLHIHTTASDGSDSPLQVLLHAAASGLHAISITDHDTVAGVTAALDAGIPSSIGFLSGVELSTGLPRFFSCRSSCHILGYGFDPEDVSLSRALMAQDKARAGRLPLMIARLNDLGIPLERKAVEEIAGRATPGRPHVALAMRSMGVVSSVEEAFQRYLGNGRPAWVPKQRMDARAAIEVIRSAGGVSVLAHPGLIDAESPTELRDLIAYLAGAGLSGVEVFYPEHTPEQTALFSTICRDFRLVATGGSDYHGVSKPEISMGVGTGSLSVPDTVLDALVAAGPPGMRVTNWPFRSGRA